MGEVMQQACKQNTPIIKNRKWKKSIEVCVLLVFAKERFHITILLCKAMCLLVSFVCI